jgi:aminoglycoside 6'-N-acetyltransferase I
MAESFCMENVDLAVQSEDIREQAASFLVEHFDEPYGWPSLASAREELARLMVEGFARAILDSEIVAGWVGGLPEYNGRVWELHPIVVTANIEIAASAVRSSN